MRKLAIWFSDYTANADPLAELAGKIALVIASNQPFYPIYLHAIAGAAAWPAWLTLLSTPLFAFVPLVARRNALLGRIQLVVVGVANTVFCVKLFGTVSGVELFLIPCALLAALLFRPAERLNTAPLLALPFLIYLFVDSHLGDPVIAFSEPMRVVALNATSVTALVTLIGLLFSAKFSGRHI